MLGGCLGLVTALIGLVLLGVAMWEYPPGLLLLPIAFFVGRRAWRKHLDRVERAQAEAHAAFGEHGPPCSVLAERHRGEVAG